MRSRSSSRTTRRRRCSSGSSSGRTCCSSSASSPTSRTRSTCTSRPPGSTSSSAARVRPGASRPLDFEAEDEAALRFGAGTVADLTWKQMLDSMSCTECGRCQDVCPAYATGKALSPKLLIMGIRDQLFAEGQAALAGGELVTARPERGHGRRRLGLRHLRRVRPRVPGLDRARRPHRRPPPQPRHGRVTPPRRDRDDAARRRARRRTRGGSRRPSVPPGRTGSAFASSSRAIRPPEILYWVGCAASFDERARTAAISTAKLLLAAGLDVAILGPRESCTGDPARRVGNEYVFQSFAQANVETLNEAGVTKIVASCPHCFNTLANEYPDFGGRYEVVHHSELLADLVRDGRLAPVRGDDDDHVPRLLLPRPPQRRAGGAARARRAHRQAARDGAERQAHVLLRRRRRAHVDGGARQPDQRGASARGRRTRVPTRSPSPAPSAR